MTSKSKIKGNSKSNSKSNSKTSTKFNPRIATKISSQISSKLSSPIQQNNPKPTSNLESASSSLDQPPSKLESKLELTNQLGFSGIGLGNLDNGKYDLDTKLQKDKQREEKIENAGDDVTDKKRIKKREVLATFFQSMSSFVSVILVGFLISSGSFPVVRTTFLGFLQGLGVASSLLPNLSLVAYVVMGLLGLFLAISCYIQNLAGLWTANKSIRVWVHSFLFSVFLVLYASGVDRQIIYSFEAGSFLSGNFGNFFGNIITIDTGIVFLPLTILHFLVIENLFFADTEHRHKNYFWLLFCQVILITLQALSLVNFLAVDRTQNRLFSWWLLDWVFSLPSEIWLGIASVFIALVSLECLQIVYAKNTTNSTLSGQISSKIGTKNVAKKEGNKESNKWWQILAIFTLLNFQSLYLVTILPINYLGYWHRMLIFIILWDFYFHFVPQSMGVMGVKKQVIKNATHNNITSKKSKKLNYGLNYPTNSIPLAIAYHLFLILLVLFLPALV